MNPPPLTAKSLQVLRLIASGLDYPQIIESHPELTYLDIFFAAEEALWQNEKRQQTEEELPPNPPSPSAESAMEKARRKHARAYAPWSEKEDAELKALNAAGKSAAEIAVHFQRQPSAIRSRLAKMQANTLTEDAPPPPMIQHE